MHSPRAGGRHTIGVIVVAHILEDLVAQRRLAAQRRLHARCRRCRRRRRRRRLQLHDHLLGDLDARLNVVGGGGDPVAAGVIAGVRRTVVVVVIVAVVVVVMMPLAVAPVRAGRLGAQAAQFGQQRGGAAALGGNGRHRRRRGGGGGGSGRGRDRGGANVVAAVARFVGVRVLLRVRPQRVEGALHQVGVGVVAAVQEQVVAVAETEETEELYSKS